MSVAELLCQDRRWRVNLAVQHDISLPLSFDGPQPVFFAAPPATARALVAGTFRGEVARGGSCNCATYTITPHCNGTHTECVGHVTSELLAIRDIAVEGLLPTRVLTVTPEPAGACGETDPPPCEPEDLIISRRCLAGSLAGREDGDLPALVLRTRPNDPSKRSRDYSRGIAPAYLSCAAARLLVSCKVRHLIVDLPSVDRSEDGGRLAVHRIFWGLKPGETRLGQARRADCTITELAYLDDSIPDGIYLLNLQIAPFAADAAPSRPVLYPLVRV